MDEEEKEESEPRQRPRRMRSPDRPPRAPSAGTSLPVAGGSNDPPRRAGVGPARARGSTPLLATITPSVHTAFLQWVGSSGKIREPMTWKAWYDAVAKRFSAKTWKAKLSEQGLANLPGARMPMLEVALQAFVDAHPEVVTSSSSA